MNGITLNKRSVNVDGVKIVSDIHIKDSDEMSMGFSEEILDNLKKDIDGIEKIIINGDLFHSFSPPKSNLKDSLNKFRDYCRRNEVELVFIKGNHDNYSYTGISSINQYQVKNKLITHGHLHPDITDDMDTIIIGHLHPLIEIEGVKQPCFLFGKEAYNGVDVLVLPAYNDYIGVDIYSYLDGLEIDCPIIEKGKDIFNYKPVINIDGEEKLFPKIIDMKKYL